MFDQLFEGFRKASESTTAAQQDMLKQWVQQWPSASLSAAGSALERNSALQKRWIESATALMNRQREALDTTCRAGVQFVEQSARIAAAKTPDDFRRLLVELWRNLFDGLKGQSEAQFQDLKKASEAWVETAQTQTQAQAKAEA